METSGEPPVEQFVTGRNEMMKTESSAPDVVRYLSVIGGSPVVPPTVLAPAELLPKVAEAVMINWIVMLRSVGCQSFGDCSVNQPLRVHIRRRFSARSQVKSDPGRDRRGSNDVAVGHPEIAVDGGRDDPLGQREDLGDAHRSIQLLGQ